MDVLKKSDYYFFAMYAYDIQNIINIYRYYNDHKFESNINIYF